MNTYTGYLLIKDSSGTIKGWFNEDGSAIDAQGEFEIRVEMSATKRAIKMTRDDASKQEKQNALKAAGKEFYRMGLYMDGVFQYTTDVLTKVDDGSRYGARVKYDLSLLKAVMDNEGRDFTKTPPTAPEQPKQREEAGPVTRTPANADSVEAILAEAKEDLDKGEITRAEWYSLRASLTK